MDCTHGHPEGSRYCALCRAEVLAAAGQLSPTYRTRPVGVPMPPWFREAVQRATTTPPPVQDELDLHEETA